MLGFLILTEDLRESVNKDNGLIVFPGISIIELSLLYGYTVNISILNCIEIGECDLKIGGREGSVIIIFTPDFHSKSHKFQLYC